jgi:hypothetical protein
MNRTAALLGVLVGVVALAGATYFTLRADERMPAASDTGPPANAPLVDEAPDGVRRPAPEAVQEPRAAVEDPAAPVVEPPPPTAPLEPSVVDPLGDSSTWPAEYENKPLEVLVADEKRLSEEHMAEMDAEIDRRFRDGEVLTYRQGEVPKPPRTAIHQVGRGDETHMRVVWMDVYADARFFRKQQKSNWLREEIRRRSQR